MADKPQITRYEVITPVGCNLDDYGNLIVTTSTNDDIKVNKRHASLHQIFENAVPTMSSVKIGYAVYMEKEYVHTAEIEGVRVISEKPIEKLKPVEVKSFQRGSPEERSSIETQVAFKGIVELLVGKVIDLKHPLAHTALNYAASKLGNWSSMGDLPDNTQAKSSRGKAESSAVVSAEEVIADLKLILDSKKITSPEVVHILREEGAKGEAIRVMVQSLSSEGLAKFAARVKPLVPHLVKEAKRLGAEEIENLPF